MCRTAVQVNQKIKIADIEFMVEAIERPDEHSDLARLILRGIAGQRFSVWYDLRHGGIGRIGGLGNADFSASRPAAWALPGVR